MVISEICTVWSKRFKHEHARADARIILEGVKTEVFQQRTKESNCVVWQKQLNQGSRTETLTLPSFTGTVNTPFRAPGGISVQIPAGEFKSQITTLSQQPCMGYLNELAARSDVNWQPVKLAHDQWNYKQEGLTPAGAALLAAAVAWATGHAKNSVGGCPCSRRLVVALPVPVCVRAGVAGRHSRAGARSHC